MKLNKDKDKIKKVIKQINKLANIDSVLWDLVDPNIDDMDSAYYMDYYNTLDAVYLTMIGQRCQEIYDSFNSPVYPVESAKKPIAWYRTRFNDRNEGGCILELISGSEIFTGYIPDNIDNIILSNKYTVDRKIELLTLMFKDLIKLDKKFKRKK